MKRLPIPVLITIVILSIEASSLTLARKVTHKSDFSSKPTYYPTGKPFTVDRERHVYIGRSASYRNEYVVYLLSIPEMERSAIEVPLPSYFKNNRDLLIKGDLYDKPGSERYSFHLEKLLCYDTSSGKAAILVSNKIREGSLTRERYLVALWDLGQKRITAVHKLAEKRYSRDMDNYMSYNFIRVPRHPGTGTLYLVQNEAPVNRLMVDGRKKTKVSLQWKVKVLAVNDEGIVPIAGFTSGRHLSGKGYIDSAGTTLFLAEYYESFHKKKGAGYLVDLVKGDITRIAIPETTYGAAFGRRGSYLYLASSETGHLWQVNRETGSLVKKLFIGTRGHSLFLAQGDNLIWIRNNGFQFIRADSMQKGPFHSIKPFISGFSHTEGSFGFGNFIFIRNQYELLLLRLQ
jgi:hypothetical protein